jgi:release factor glutamine methyltransferase
MTLNEAFREGIEILKDADNEAPARDAGVLLCSVVRCDRVFLYAHGTDELDLVQIENYFSMLKSRAGGMPLQYLTGVQEFMSLPFEVGRGVLVPRQETELLAETVMNLCKQRHSTSILDIGTGSGCIAVSLAYYLPECSVTAIDKMSDAVDIAQRNALTNGVADRVRFVISNLFEKMAEEKFDVIVSNPPYIRTADIKGLQREVRCYEPKEALDGGNDGLDFYRAIISEAPDFLNDSGILAFEVGYDQAAEVTKLMSSRFGSIKTYKDLAGIDRTVTGVCR